MNLALLVLTLAQLPAGDVLDRVTSGTLVDTAGRGVAGAEVWITSTLDAERLRRTFWLGEDYPDWKLANKLGGVEQSVRTDAAGRFSSRLPDRFARDPSPPPLALWIIHANRLLGVRQLSEMVYSPPEPLTMDRATAHSATVRVVGSDDAPVVDANVACAVVSRIPFPRKLAERFAGQTDAKGEVTLRGIAPEVVHEVRVETRGLGIQRVWLEKNANGLPAMARLAGVGSIAGKFSGDGDLSGIKVYATTHFEGYETSGVRGLAEVACDDDGHFEIPAIAAGRLSLHVSYPIAGQSLLGAPGPEDLVVESSERLELTIPLKPAVRISGVIRESETNLRVRDVQLTLSGYDRLGVTDADGRYSGYQDAGMREAYAFPRTFPLPFVLKAANDTAIHRLPDSGDVELDDIELVRGVRLAGQVLDEQGQGVVAVVEARWIGPEGYGGSSFVRSDARGAFVLEGAQPEGALWLRARSVDAASDELKLGGGRQNVTLRVKTAAMLAPLTGRVVDVQGRGVAGADVDLRYEGRRKFEDEEGFEVSDGGLWDGDDRLVTDAEGRFRTAHPVLGEGNYCVTVAARGFLPAASPWTRRTAGSPSLGDVVLRRVKAVTGQVVDREGRGVAGALVRQSGDGPMRTRAVTNADGRFRLSGIVEGPAALLVTRQGYRLAGALVDSESPLPPIVLSRQQDAGGPHVQRNLASALSKDEERAIAQRLARVCLEYALTHENDPAREFAWDLMFSLDPPAALERLNALANNGDKSAEYFVGSFAKYAAPKDRQQAFVLIDALPDPAQRASDYWQVSETMRSEAERSARIDALERALAAARAIKDPGARVSLCADIAGSLWNAGAVDRARQVIEAERPVADTLDISSNGPGQRRCSFAVVLAVFDLPAALEMIEASRVEDVAANGGGHFFVFDRYYRAIAARLAKGDPAAAVRVIGMATPDHERDTIVPRICHALARRDLAAAERLAKTIDPARVHLQARARGLMALALAATDKPAAARLLGEAFAGLELAVEEGRLDLNYLEDAIEVAGALVQFAEEIDPFRVSEYLWRAVALRPARRRMQDVTYYRACEKLGMVLSFYDRELARFVMAPAADEMFATTFASRGYEIGLGLEALALVDPRRAATLAESVPIDSFPDMPYFNPRLRVATVLATQGEARWRKFFCPKARWSPDDLEP
jgi:hypothetical protein